MSIPLKKLPNNLECPIDTFVYMLIEPIAPLLRKLNLTPNMITTVSAIFGIFAIYFLCKKNILYFAIGFIMYYILDDLDGYYARRYNMCSRFGDYYDHIKDLMIVGSIISILVYQSLKTRNYYAIGAILLSSFLFGVQISCQEQYVDHHNLIPTNHACYSPSLRTVSLCPNYKFLGNMKYFGMGFYILYLTAITAYIYR
jgi:phosphatidylglycerophosphate synthase